MAVLGTKQRNRMPRTSFAIPETKSYPINDRQHGANALTRVKQHGTADEKGRVYRAVCRRYKSLPACQAGFEKWNSGNYS
jgi:hypothetical protein